MYVAAHKPSPVYGHKILCYYRRGRVTSSGHPSSGRPGSTGNKQRGRRRRPTVGPEDLQRRRLWQRSWWNGVGPGGRPRPPDSSLAARSSPGPSPSTVARRARADGRIAETAEKKPPRRFSLYARKPVCTFIDAVANKRFARAAVCVVSRRRRS